MHGKVKNMNPKLSFIIQAHNEEKVIANCLRSLEAIRAYFPAMEVVMGLDGCTDRTMEIAQGFPKVRIVAAKERIGKTETENRGLAAATGDLIWVIWADEMVVANQAQMEWLAKQFEDDPKLGGGTACGEQHSGLGAGQNGNRAARARQPQHLGQPHQQGVLGKNEPREGPRGLAAAGAEPAL